jgi:hypothetical protein
MCYSLQATVASWVLGTHEFVWALVWVGTHEAYNGVDQVAVSFTVGWLYFALLIQLVDFVAWLVLLTKKDAVKSMDNVRIEGTETVLLAGLFLVMLQPTACMIAPTAISYATDFDWKVGILTTTVVIATFGLLYTIALALTLTEKQRVFHGSRHAGLAHQWFDYPHGAVGRLLPPAWLYNVCQVVSSFLQISVAVFALGENRRSFVIVITVCVLYWQTYMLAFGVSAPPTASRMSTVWCWFVGGGMFIATALTLWDEWAMHAVHVATAAAATALAYYLTRMRERSMVNALGADPDAHMVAVGLIPFLNF